MQVPSVYKVVSAFQLHEKLTTVLLYYYIYEYTNASIQKPLCRLNHNSVQKSEANSFMHVQNCDQLL